jgi:hypothetical protein
MTSSMLVAPVDAAVGPARVVTVSPADGIVLVEGLNHADTYTVTVLRDGIAVGSATGSPTTYGVFGALELNHAAEPTFCWDGVTPSIRPGDEVRVTGPGVDDSVAVQDITVAGNPEPAGDAAFTVTGTLGEGLDLADVDVFVRLDLTPDPPGGDDDNPEPEDPDDDAGDWRASSSDPGNTLAAGPGNTWTATFTTGDQAEEPAPVTAEVLAAATNPRVLEATHSVGSVPVGEEDGGNERTTAVVDGAGDPLPDGCPLPDGSAIGAVSPSVINLANRDSGITVSGVSESPTVEVSVDDADADADDATTHSAVVRPNGTWTASIPGPLTALEGQLTVTAEHSDGGGATLANTRHALRDTEAPAAPQSFPDSRSFSTSLQVLLAGSGEIRYTEGDGSQPPPTTPASGRRYTGTILLTQTTTLKAVAVDAAGNLSPVMTRTFTRDATTVPSGPVPPTPQVPPPPDTGTASVLPLAPGIAKATSGRKGGNATASVRWRVPLANGAVLDGYQVRALKLRPGRAAKVLPAVSVASDRTRLKMSLRRAAYRFQVRAVSAAGTSPWSERSTKVRSR